MANGTILVGLLGLGAIGGSVVTVVDVDSEPSQVVKSSDGTTINALEVQPGRCLLDGLA